MASEPGMARLIEKLKFQGWEHLLRCPLPRVHEFEVVEFYINLEVVGDGEVKSMVNGVRFTLTERMVGEILQVPREGYAEYDRERTRDSSLTTKFTQGRVITGYRRVIKGEMSPDHKLLYELVNKCFLPRTERRHEASYRDLGLMKMIDVKQKVNLHLLMI